MSFILVLDIEFTFLYLYFNVDFIDTSLHILDVYFGVFCFLFFKKLFSVLYFSLMIRKKASLGSSYTN